MFVVIAGGGRTGTQLATMLLNQDHQVHVIEHRPEVLVRIHKELPTEIIFQGNYTNPGTLENAGLPHANVLAACTVNDDDNLAICYMARSLYQVPRTIARVNNPRNAWLFDEKFHVDVALNNAEIMARLIEEEMSMGDMMTLLKLRRGDYSLVEEKIPPGSQVIGKMLKDLPLTGDCVIAAVIRSGKVVLPRGVTVFEQGDEVLAVTDSAGARLFATLFGNLSPKSS